MPREFRRGLLKGASRDLIQTLARAVSTTAGVDICGPTLRVTRLRPRLPPDLLQNETGQALIVRPGSLETGVGSIVNVGSLISEPLSWAGYQNVTMNE